MGLGDIEQKIRESGERELVKIKSDTEVEIKKIEDEISKESLRAYNDIMTKSSREKDLIYKGIISNAHMASRLLIEKKKSEIIDRVFDDAKCRILNMSDNRKEKILEKLADDAKKNVRNPVVYVDKKYKNLISAEISEIGDFGVIVESKDSKMRVDNTLNKIMSRLKIELKPKIAKILFSQPFAEKAERKVVE